MISPRTRPDQKICVQFSVWSGSIQGNWGFKGTANKVIFCCFWRIIYIDTLFLILSFRRCDWCISWRSNTPYPSADSCCSYPALLRQKEEVSWSNNKHFIFSWVFHMIVQSSFSRKLCNCIILSILIIQVLYIIPCTLYNTKVEVNILISGACVKWYDAQGIKCLLPEMFVLIFCIESEM